MSQKTAIIITGASGRMGTMLCNALKDHESLELAGVIDKQERLNHVAHLNVPQSADAAQLFAQIPHAVVIDFTSPEASLHHAKEACKTKTALVIGTTGLTPEQQKELAEYATQTPIFWSPNMSVGVNALVQVLPQLTKILGADYDVEVLEVHHNRKQDAPSGTALHLAECIAQAKEWKLADTANYHREGIIGPRPKKEIGMQTLRGGDVVGIHTVYFFGQGERIEVTHHAHSRESFAHGALRASAWLRHQPAGKLYTMKDVL